MSKWISVEDRLPESKTSALVANDESGIIRLWYRWRGRWMSGGDKLPEYVTEGVTHWQPLPDPPEV